MRCSRFLPRVLYQGLVWHATTNGHLYKQSERERKIYIRDIIQLHFPPVKYLYVLLLLYVASFIWWWGFYLLSLSTMNTTQLVLVIHFFFVCFKRLLYYFPKQNKNILLSKVDKKTFLHNYLHSLFPLAFVISLAAYFVQERPAGFLLVNALSRDVCISYSLLKTLIALRASTLFTLVTTHPQLSLSALSFSLSLMLLVSARS